MEMILAIALWCGSPFMRPGAFFEDRSLKDVQHCRERLYACTKNKLGEEARLCFGKEKINE